MTFFSHYRSAVVVVVVGKIAFECDSVGFSKSLFFSP